MTTGRLCIITHEIGDLGGPGSVGHSFLGVVEATIDAGFAVDVILTSQEHATVAASRKQNKGQSFQIVSLEDIYAENSHVAVENEAPCLSYHIFLYLSRRNYTSVHFQDSHGYGFYTALARRQGILPCVVVTHLNGGKQWLREIEGGVVELADLEQEAMERAQVESSDLLLGQSQEILSWYKAKGIELPPHRILTWPLPKWAQNLAIPADFDFKQELEPARIVFWGSQSERHGFDLFLKTIATFPGDRDFEVWIIGPFTHIQNEFSGCRALRKLSSRAIDIHFLPDMPAKEAVEWITRLGSALCVLPYRADWEPFDLTLLSAFSVPFVTCRARSGSRAGSLTVVGEPETAALIQALHRSLDSAIKEPHTHRGLAAQHNISTSWQGVLSSLIQLREQCAPAPSLDQLPLVSICLVHHERPHFLSLAIKALMEQTYAKIEIVVVDDGSTDGHTAAVLQQLEQGLFRFPIQVLRSKNRYLGAARNLAASAAKGDFLLFHDDDNIAEINLIELLVKAAASTGADILTCFNYAFSYHDEIPIGKRAIRHFPTGIQSLYAFFSNRFGDANALFRKTVFFELGGFTEYRGIGWEDWEIFLRASMHGKQLRVVPTPLFNYRVSDDGMLASTDLAANFERIFALLDEVRPDFGSEILRFAQRGLLRDEIRNAKLATSKKDPLSSLQPDLIGLQPNSAEALEAFLTLGRRAGWLCGGDLPPTGSLRPQLSFTRPSRGFGTSVVQYSVLQTGDRFLLFRGWSVGRHNWCVVPKGVSFDNTYYQRLAYATHDRPDVTTHLGLKQGNSQLGFVALCRESAPPSLRWFRSRFSRVTVAGHRKAAVHFERDRAKVTEIDEVRDYCEAYFDLPEDGWTGRVRLIAPLKFPLFYRDASGSYREISQTEQNHRVFDVDPTSHNDTVHLIVPRHLKIQILCERG